MSASLRTSWILWRVWCHFTVVCGGIRLLTLLTSESLSYDVVLSYLLWRFFFSLMFTQRCWYYFTQKFLSQELALRKCGNNSFGYNSALCFWNLAEWKLQREARWAWYFFNLLLYLGPYHGILNMSSVFLADWLKRTINVLPTSLCFISYYASCCNFKIGYNFLLSVIVDHKLW